jgi:hypothetical protein
MFTAEQIEQINEQAAAKAEELSKSYNTKVHPLVFCNPNEDTPCVGYLKEPSRRDKMIFMDNSVRAYFSAGENILKGYLIKEESDPRILSDSSQNDVYFLGALTSVQSIIVMAFDQFKKK